MSFAKIVLMGNLGRDPELRYTTNGTPVCSFSMATTEKRKDKTGEMQEKTLWARVTLWGRQAETAAQYLTKGRAVYIEGRPSLDEWTDKDGKARTTLEVNATDMQFVGGGGGDDNRGGGGQSGGGYQGNRSQGQQSQGGRAPGPREQFHQARQQQPAAGGEGGGLALDGDDEAPF